MLQWYASSGRQAPRVVTKRPRTTGSAGRKAAPATRPAGRPTSTAARSGKRSASSAAAEAVATRPETRRRARHGQRVALGCTLAATFAAALVLYLVTLAPTVTFEDSGELIAAAYTLGVPHEPGYPLWTMIAHLFTWLPVGDVAYRVNLMSAVCSSLAAALIAWMTLLVIDGMAAARPGARLTSSTWLPELEGQALWLACAAAAAAGILAATARTTWSQSIIAEVYGLNAALVGLLALLTVAWTRSATPKGRTRLFYAICFVLGLGLTSHDTFVLLLPVLALYGFLIARRLRPTWRQLVAGIGLFFAGLLPYLYLPLAARRRPVMNWGNPGTAITFWRTITRRQYASGGHSGLTATLHELSTSAAMLWHQWFPGLLALAVVGLVVLYRRRRGWFWFSVAFLVFMGPLVTIVTDFPVATTDRLVNADDKALVSVFYIPSYLMIATLIALGGWWLATLAAGRLGAARGVVAKDGVARGGLAKEGAAPGAVAKEGAASGGRWLPALALAAVLVAVPLGLAWATVGGVTMHDYRFADAYIHNVFSVARPHALVMVDRDQFGFPLMYAQMVEHLRPDVVVLDQELLRRSWYLQDLTYQRPALIAASRPQVDAFLAAVKPFEAGQSYDSNVLDTAYFAMLTSFVERSETAGHDVYFTYPPDQRLVRGYTGESVVVAFRARRGAPARGAAGMAAWLTPVDLAQFDFSHLTDGAVPLDRNVLMVRSWYGELLAARAQLLEKAGDGAQAARLADLSRRFLAAGDTAP